MPDKDDSKTRTSRASRQPARQAARRTKPAVAAMAEPGAEQMSPAQIEAKREQLRRKYH